MMDYEGVKQESVCVSENFEPDLVSVIVPSYNRASFLPGLVRNIQAQDYRPVEIIIVDDGSTDATSFVVKEDLLASDRNNEIRVRYFRQENKGPSSARNSGLCCSRGEFIQFLDTDDRLLPPKLSVQAQFLRDHPDVDYVYCNTVQIGSKGRPNAIIGKQMDEEKIAMHIPLYHWHSSGPLYRRSVCREVGPWDEALTMSEDWEYAARVKALSQKGVYLPEILSEYVLHSGDQMVKERSVKHTVSRNKAIHNVLGLVKTVGDPDRWGIDVCARALVANGITAGVQGESRMMRRNIALARSIGRLRTRCLAAILYGMTFFVPMTFLEWMLKMARRYGI